MTARFLHPALLLLIRMSVRAKWRRLRTALRTPKGIVAALAMIAFAAMAILPSLLMGMNGERLDPAVTRAGIPVGLFSMCLLNLVMSKADTGVVFQPAEVDFLFPAPFRRSELLLYKIVGMTMTSMCLGLFFSALALRYVSMWIAALVGTILVLIFIQFFQMSVALIASTLQEKVYTAGRRVILIVVAALVLFGVSSVLASAGQDDILTSVKRFRESWVAAVLLAPFEVFARTICAETIFPDLLGWGAASAAVVLVMFAIILKLDANFLETAAATSLKRYEMLQRAKSGNPWGAMRSSGARWRIPQFPRWGGAGPIAWRQAATALRASRGILLIMVIFGTGFAVSISVSSNAALDAGPFVGIVIAMSLIYLPMLLRFDFRGDIERIDVLKSLPISPRAMVAGQLITPIVFASALQMLCFSGMAILQRDVSDALILAVVFLVPANLLVFGIENLVFLVYPYQLGSPDLQSHARLMLVMLVKMVILFVMAGLAAGAGGLAYLVCAESWTAFIITSWLAATAMAIGILPAICWSYRRIDPSVDISK